MFLWFQSWSVKHDYANSDTTILSESYANSDTTILSESYANSDTTILSELETADTSRLAIH